MSTDMRNNHIDKIEEASRVAGMTFSERFDSNLL